MNGFRASASALIAASVSCALLTAPGCGTDAQGISDCRAIERERCAAAAQCGVVSDVDSCQRFYRDQCLHGTTTGSPGAPQVDKCVLAIRAAGECAAATADTQDAVCAGSLTPGATGTACDAILSPERLRDCSFLSPTPVDGEGGTSSTGDDPSTTAGAGGQGNTSSGNAEGGAPAGGVSGG